MHWGSSLNTEERDIVLNWARNARAAQYADAVAEAYANEPIRPIAETLQYDEAKAALGYALFHDTRLSVDNTVSCASCHDLSTAGVDNHQYSHGVDDQLGGVNAPTVYNAVYNFYSSGMDALKLSQIRLQVLLSIQLRWHRFHSTT